MKLNQVLVIIGCSFLSAFLALKFNSNTNLSEDPNEVEKTIVENIVKQVKYVNDAPPVSFTSAASLATPFVVHVSSKYVTDQQKSRDFYGEDIFEWFFGQQFRQQPRGSTSSGSGVIISEDGFIVTNNHVVDRANKIEITLSNNKKYVADIVGRDKDTDIALLKINEENLPFAGFANSDDVLVGEWVLAVGNPFNLSSTVTAGIVSAKGRSINILENFQGRSNTAIESFIQTDAAVNPGNSGGALVNLDGDLIGINTAIATPTGTFAGYSFAVPANIVSKVVSDLKDYGMVQRGFLGVSIRDVNSDMAKELQLTNPNGVYLQDILPDGAADNAGLKSGDVIVAINGETVKNAPDLQQKVARFRPGNVISVSYIRKGTTITTDLELKNIENGSEVISKK